MRAFLKALSVQNFRCIENLDNFHFSPINVLFGPNGAGKSTFLDSIWFIRDCAIRGIEEAASSRSHGIGMMWNGQKGGDNPVIHIGIESEEIRYDIEFSLSSGRVDSLPSEKLHNPVSGNVFLKRQTGAEKADFRFDRHDGLGTFTLKDPDKLALSQYPVSDRPETADNFERMFHYIRYYLSREAGLYKLRTYGSESSHHTHLWDRGQNLWSVLRNLHDRRDVDERFDTIIRFMRKAFPKFKNLVLEQTGLNSVYASFIESNVTEPIFASGVSDGHLQLLLHLAALFGEGDRDTILLFDEPETSLHPYAIAVFAEAVQLAAEKWNKQIFLATHSPVLVSQFDPGNVIAAQISDNGSTSLQRVSDMDDCRDLLEGYSLGSLYMAEMLARQSKPDTDETCVAKGAVE